MSESKSTLGRPVTTPSRRSSGYRTVTSTAAGEDPSFRPAAPKSTRAAHRDNPEVASIRNIAPTLSRLPRPALRAIRIKYLSLSLHEVCWGVRNYDEVQQRTGRK